jgi:hypothetical protein
MGCNLQQGYFLAWLKRTHPGLCRQEPYVSLAYGIGSSFVLNLPCPTDAHQHTRLCHGANCERLLTEQSPHPEWFAIKESLALNGHGCLYAGRNQAAGAPLKIYAGKRPIDLKRPWLSSLRVYMTPVVKAECNVAVLLNLEDDNITAQSVNRSRRDEYGITWFGDNAH